MSARRLGALAALAFAALILAGPAATTAAAGVVGWSVQTSPQPSVFSPADAVPCAQENKCDSYQLKALNVGDQASSPGLTLTDTLPVGIKLREYVSGEIRSGENEGIGWACSQAMTTSVIVTCTYAGSIPPGAYAPNLGLVVKAPAASLSGKLKNEVTVTGGGAGGAAKAVRETAIASQAPPFQVNAFELEPGLADGTRSSAAAAHPAQVTTTVEVPSKATPAGECVCNSFLPGASTIGPVEQIKSVAVDLPVGLIGNPQATPHCTELAFESEACPPGSAVGVFALAAGGFEGAFTFTAAPGFPAPSAVYNMVPQKGYPAEFGFSFARQTVYMYASVVHTSAGYVVRVAIPGVTTLLGAMTASVTFFGDPGAQSAGPTQPAFLTNPADCSAGALAGQIELRSWENPAQPAFGQADAYSAVSDCEALQFHPTLGLQPDTNAADSPAGLNVDLEVPQTSEFEELATPPLRDATVTLPEGLAVNPAAADGLQGCAATGPAGINLGSGEVGPGGQDLGDPEATELGAGYGGGNASPYEDGFYHSAPGHCPAASTLGSAEITTPLLPEPLPGKVFLGAPDCSPCSNADAQAGKLLKLYIEINDPKTGVVLKLPGTVSADPGSGRLTASFTENPQLPFSDLKLHFKTGSRAALVTPQTCGSYQTSSDLRPWSAPETPDATSDSSFTLSSGPNGGACASPQPNQPAFTAGSASPAAGAFSPFLLKLSREDGSQRIKALNVTLPPGLSGRLAGVPYCSEAQIAAAAGHSGNAEKAGPSCPLASEVGTVNVGAGAGPNPFYVQGHAYLAGPYKGAPLSLAIITPAVAGPFDLGTVVVRAGLYVNPETAQITVKSDPIPQILAGIPLDVRSIAVNVSRNQFTLNPTSCNPLAVTGTAFGASSDAALTSPFQVGGCSALAFKPHLSLRLKGPVRRTANPKLIANLTARPGEANIARAQVKLPKAAFLDNAHIGTVCTRVQFSAGAKLGEGCPASSVYGHARAVTPLLDQPLEGPVYLRSSSHELPDLVAALNGQIEVALAGKTDSVKGALRNTFEAVPDAPVSSFHLELFGGKKGLIEMSSGFCQSPRASVKLTAQNGKTHDTEPVVTNSCKGKHKHKRHAHRAAR